MSLPGGWELVLILLVVVLLFGAKRLPDAARSLGRSMRIFKSEVKEMGNDDKEQDQPVMPQQQQIPAPQQPAAPMNPQQYMQNPAPQQQMHPQQGTYPQGQYPQGGYPGTAPGAPQNPQYPQQ